MVQKYNKKIVTSWCTKWILESNLPYSTIEHEGNEIYP